MSDPTFNKTRSQSTVSPEALLNRETADFRDTWRVFRIMAELVEGYNFLSGLQDEVTIFGSARFPETHEYYIIAQELGSLLAKNGFTTITGGGPGIMQAANRGAYEAGGESVGLNIQLPFEQRINPYVKKSTAFYYFFTRKVMLTSPANAFVFFPGGFGTFDEFFEVIDLIDLHMLSDAPIVLVGKKFWDPIIAFLHSSCEHVGSITEEMLAKWHVVDTAEDAFACIKDVKEVTDTCDLSPVNFHSRGNIDWKIFRVMSELVEGFDFVSGLNHAVTILGTKSIAADSPYYNAAHTLGAALAAHNYSVVTGGKLGIAEAANKGAFEAGGTSVGIGMRIGTRPAGLNPYLTKSILFSFPFTRKFIMSTPTQAFVFFPGGFGTLHQLFEALTLIQTKKMDRVPVILFNRTFWAPIDEFVKSTMQKMLQTIGPTDNELYTIVDSIDEVTEIIESFHSANHPDLLSEHLKKPKKVFV